MADYGANSAQDSLQDLFQKLPLPLAQVLKRALNGKSAVERHHCTYYLAEASLKLAAAVRIGLWLSRGEVVGSNYAEKLKALAFPSTGHWLSFLREMNQALAALPDAALFPLARDASELGRKRPEWDGVRTFSEKVAHYGVVSPQVAAEARLGGVIGFFSLVVAYRNDVLGHASQRSNAFYDEMGPVLLASLCEVLSCSALFGGLDLAHARLEMNEQTSESAVVWHRLRGLGGVPLKGGASGATAGELYFIGPGATIPLHPLAVYREDELGREQVGFLNGTVTKARKTGVDGPSIIEVRRSEYLDYTSGETVTGVDAHAALTRLLSLLLGKKVSEEDLQSLESRTIAEMPQEPAEDVVGAGAVIGGFELLGEIGRGAMGVVYKARQQSLGRIVALKVLPPMLAADAVTVKRFKNEIAVLARCDHPNVVKILSSGVDGDRYYYAMELKQERTR